MRLTHLTLISAIALGALGVQQAKAIGCVSGGAAGAVVGHVAGHHAMLGAVGGCITGHEMNKHQKKLQHQQATQNSPNP